MPLRASHFGYGRMYRKGSRLICGAAVFALAASAWACGGGGTEVRPSEETVVASIRLTSVAFADGQPIPARYTCDGEDKSPALKWTGLPQGARSIALIVDDPDAPGRVFVHWVLYGIPVSMSELPEAVSGAARTSFGARNGTNDFRRSGYGGPCPPRGNPHRYIFTLYALDGELDLEPGASKKEARAAMEGHILAEGRLMGTYQRR